MTLIPKERIVQAWNELVDLGAVVRAWDEGEERCHWELDENVFNAFKVGFEGWFLDEDLIYTKTIFSEAQKNE